jgi:hypothetical protein
MCGRPPDCKDLAAGKTVEQCIRAFALMTIVWWG